MKRDSLEAHLKAKHGAYMNSSLDCFKSLKEKFAKRSTIRSLFNEQTTTVSRTLEASDKTSSLVAKSAKIILWERN